MTQTCIRCGKPAPDIEDDEFVEWEAADDEGTEIICPGCLTGTELVAMADDVGAMRDMLSRCARCGAVTPDDAEDEHGWLIVDEGFVCAACITPAESLLQAVEDQAAGLEP